MDFLYLKNWVFFRVNAVRENPVSNLDIEHINVTESCPPVSLNINNNESTNEDIYDIPTCEKDSILDLPTTSAASLKWQLPRIVNLCQVARDWVHHSCDASVMDTSFPSTKKRNIRCKQPDCVSIYMWTQTDCVCIIGSNVLKRHFHYLATLS